MHQHNYQTLLSPIEPPGMNRPAISEKGVRGTAFFGNSLVEMLRFRAAVQPKDCAYTFLDDGETPGASVNYSQLDCRSRAIAALLQAQVQPGARALLLYPPGLDFIAAFFGCLYAGAVAVPVPLPNLRRSLRSTASISRLAAVIADSKPDAVLSTSDILTRLAHTAGEAGNPLAPVLQCETGDGHSAGSIATDAVCDDAAAAWRDPNADQRTLAFLQYTSGSTAAPKGVMISHGNLLHNLAQGFRFSGNDAATVSVSWLPMTHDMGLIDGVLQPVYSGCPAYLMSPAAFLQRPVRWLQAISRYRATRSGAPNFAYDLCVRKITAEDRDGLDLSAWRIAYNGAEPVRHETLASFAATFSPCGFRPAALRPCYGLAEATLFVTGSRSGTGPALLPANAAASSSDMPGAGAPVSCGDPISDMRLCIVNPESFRPCPQGDTGEIWISGPSIASGYWNHIQESARTFNARTSEGDGPFLRTGDLGFLRDGQLFVTGRCKDVLIIRGAKHYPQDLEQTAEQQHLAIRPGCVAAFTMGHGSSNDRIVLAAEVDIRRFGSPSAGGNIIAAIRRAVAESHGVQLHAVLLIEPGAIPKTTSGKLQRFACREAFVARSFPILAKWSEATGDVEDLSAHPAQIRPPAPIVGVMRAECL